MKEKTFEPVVHLDDLTDLIEHQHGGFHAKYMSLTERMGAQQLGYNLTVVLPGKKVCPFHNHRNLEELFLVLEGEGVLRFGDQEFPVKAHSLISCPPGGPSVAHQIRNTGSLELKYLALSTSVTCDVVEYPDSDKVMAYAGTYPNVDLRHISRRSDAVDYFEGEDAPAQEENSDRK